jgi:DNA-binding MarR family transcriptional regulator
MLLSRRMLDVSRKSKTTLTRRLTRIGARPYMQLRVLQEIAEHEGTTQAGLGERLCLDAPAISRTVKNLVDDGLVRRKAMDDRRSASLQISAAGRRELSALQEQQQLLDQELQASLTPAEQLTLSALLQKLDDVADALAAAPDDAA